MPTKYITMYTKHKKDQLQCAVSSSLTMADVCRKLGIKPATGSQTHLKKRIIAFEIDISHFVGRSIAKGRSPVTKKPIEYFLVTDGPYVKSDYLKKRLIKEKFKKHECETCHTTVWNEEPVPIELDHINGRHNDNRLENLRIVCPNCHAQTATYCSKNRLLQRKISQP